MPDRDVPVARTTVSRSRFLTSVHRADTRAAALGFVDQVRSTYPEARHHCSAFIVEEEGRNPIEHSSDDGEPAGTAGAPILGAIRAAGLTNVCVVVTRYFGGTLLGTGGLTRAYSQAATTALADVPRVEVRTLDLYALETNPGSAGRTEAAIRSAGLMVDAIDYRGDGVTMRIAVPAERVEELRALVGRSARGRATIRHVGNRTRTVDIAERDG